MKNHQATETRNQELQQHIDQDKLTLETLAMGARTQELLTKALIIGGSVALGYLMYRQLAGSKRSGILSTLLMGAVSVVATDEGRKLLQAGKDTLSGLIKKE
jgi:hypothetical protein